MWLKAGFEAHSGSDHLRAIYLGEALFYRDLAAQLDLGTPRAFAARVDDATGQSFLLLEDLLARHVTFGHASRPLTPDGGARVLELLARLHARYWGSDALAPYAWLQGGGALGQSGVFELTFTPEFWNRCAGLPRGELMTGDLGDREAVRDVTRRLLRHDLENAHCLAHGDPQLMNMYFDPAGQPGYLDWQTAMFGFWAHDVTEFIVTALTTEDRRRSERQLVAHYVEQLRRCGVSTLSAEAAWAEYRRHTAYTFHWLLCLPEWQPENVVLANARRAQAAILDHDSLAAW
jgi:hypothetical protein